MPTPAYISITGKTQGNITQGAVKVAMAYRKITWTRAIAGTEASDDQRKPLES
ncbi:hypothetical protein [Achromobacter sp. NFACC18-2]|uniref:hypothetical protein n=1 Tax=Achromobacter sp. NFACC18-2 TaxID=1564112 RepID=UPI0008AC52AE|nr:hypothetical protein [Achromobacter sp. NFACC18-2]SEK09799.1 type VI secretion system secreted protein Hcp [Achromobacter sp. NFACC18-2]